MVCCRLVFGCFCVKAFVVSVFDPSQPGWVGDKGAVEKGEWRGVLVCCHLLAV